MAKPKRVTFFKANLEDKPGALLAIAKELKTKNLGLVALTGFGTQTGHAELIVIPKNSEKLRAAWKSEDRSKSGQMAATMGTSSQSANGSSEP